MATKEDQRESLHFKSYHSPKPVVYIRISDISTEETQ